MRIAMIGTGYVGLVSGACFSEFGTQVVCIDRDRDKIDRLHRGEVPIFEPGLEDLVASNVEAGRLSFATGLSELDEGVDAVFIAVGTPSRRGDGHADLTFVFEAAREIAQVVPDDTVIVTKSTVPVGTGRKIEEILRAEAPGKMLHVASNPEFLREGSAIGDFMRPDRIIIGAESERAQSVLRALYRPLYLIETPVIFTSLETAELAKYAANAFLATKITFINEIADLCEAVGADVHDVARGMGLDGRIGRKFLHPGPGYGGSCFPKDTLALVRTAEQAKSPVRIVETVVEVNDDRKRRMADKIVAHCNGTVDGKTIAVLGVTFKPNTDDMREAPSLSIIPILQEQGARIRAYDPEGMEEAAKVLSGVAWCDDAWEAVEDADALVILTEWNQFRNLDLTQLKQSLAQPVIADLRNIYDPAEMWEHGFSYTCIGRAFSDDRPGALINDGTTMEKLA